MKNEEYNRCFVFVLCPCCDVRHSIDHTSDSRDCCWFWSSMFARRSMRMATRCRPVWANVLSRRSMRSAAGSRHGGSCIASRPSVLSRRSVRLAFNCGLRATLSSTLVWPTLLSWRSLWSSAWIRWFQCGFPKIHAGQKRMMMGLLPFEQDFVVRFRHRRALL